MNPTVFFHCPLSFVLADQLDRQSLSELDQVAHDVEGEPSSSDQQQMLGGSALPPRHEIASLTSLVWGIAMLRVKASVITAF